MLEIHVQTIFFLNLCRIVSLSCSPTGTAFVCSTASSKRPSHSTALPLRLNQGKSRQSEVSSSASHAHSSNVGMLQCWDMKNMKFEVSIKVMNPFIIVIPLISL